MASESTLRIERGRLLCYRVFDVADEIHLDGAERQIAGGPAGRRVKLSREGSETLSFAAQPLDLGLGRRAIALPRTGITVEAEVSARFFDFGTASIRFEIPVASGTELLGLVPLCDELYDTPALGVVGRNELDSLLRRIEPAIQGRHEWRGVETYTVIFVEELQGSPPVEELLGAYGLGKLLVGEVSAKRLSTEERSDVLKHAYRYFDDDLAVIDWNSAFLLEPSGSRDIPDILEFATCQMLELRYYDDLLDAELGRIYDRFAVAKRRPWALFWSPYGRLARGVLRRVIELTEMTERVENSLKLIGDFYLARVYRAAVRRFRLSSWQDSVNRKQSLVMQVYELLKGDVDIRRNTLLELAIVLLIVFEIGMAILGQG